MMSAIEPLREEFSREARTTRRHLERLPDNHLEWRPHPKSFSLGGLASHIVECVRWGEPIFAADEFDMNPAAYEIFEASSVADLMRAFDAKVSACEAAMQRSSDADLRGMWRLKVRGRQRFERPREAVFRDFTMSHLIHHRGQLTVYLRLLDVPVPGSYGPTADDAPGT